MLTAMVYMNERGIAHQDIKIENILLTLSIDIVFIDFGFSVFYKDRNFRNTNGGCEPYFAPERV